jgi:hypothetical protein
VLNRKFTTFNSRTNHSLNVVNNAEKRNSLRNIFISSKQREWRKNHVIYWQNFLELNNSGFSLFQIELRDKLIHILSNNTISYVTEIVEHRDLNDESRIVKMITLTSDDNLKFWIYHDMAELEIDNKHEIYEEWGYLKPQDLIDRYLKSTEKLLISKNS